MKYSKKKRMFTDEKGFTLMELVIVMVIVGIITVTTMPFIRTNVDSYISVRGGKDLLQSTRIGFNRMLAEMRRIESPSDIDYGYNNEFQFDIPGTNNITYKYSGGQLLRENRVLIHGVQSMTFRYFRQDGSQMGTPIWSSTSQIWRIQLDIEVGDGTQNIRLRAQVSPRNFHL
ncbi:MAG TPA: prepilin-type N-terminal cleavage/methylation domain-containing protein [bacterium]|nr:prepilin-type N-terminal cleavage/methylation domain-containing protein [bacterium]